MSLTQFFLSTFIVAGVIYIPLSLLGRKLFYREGVSKKYWRSFWND